MGAERAGKQKNPDAADRRQHRKLGKKSGERDRTAVDERVSEPDEVIISNNDDMALGAWEALEEKGCTEVQVVGIDGIEEVRELVDEDKILGSVLCDTKLHAKALMQFIDVLAFHNGSVENLENERYYMIPLTKVEK